MLFACIALAARSAIISIMSHSLFVSIGAALPDNEVVLMKLIGMLCANVWSSGIS